MMKKIIFFAALLCISFMSFTQNGILLQDAEIEFEKKINTYAVNNITSFDAKPSNDKFRITHFTLRFNRDYTKYIPAPSNLLLERAEQPAENNLVYTDLLTKQYQSWKNVFETKYTVEDTLPKISWKITGEKRNIAGFECRRANAIILDSVYVVAFYADNIPTGGGPELFNGLPGMILAVSLPHLHINWTATKITSRKWGNEDLQKQGTNTPVTADQLKGRLMEALKSRGTGWNYFLLQSLL